MLSTIQDQIKSSVQQFYERFPYPHYPLLAKPRWQDGYLSSPLFVRRLLGLPLSKPATVLIVGCGEMQPYIFNRWNLMGTTIWAVDLSARTLRRAKIRLLGNSKNVKFHQGDICDFLESKAGKNLSFDHIDAYGVLHHLPDPARAIRLLSNALSKEGSMRIMVYNHEARDWIWNLRKSFQVLGLKPGSAADIKRGRLFLGELRKVSPRSEHFLSQMGSSFWKNINHFADTFFHAHECKQSLDQWATLLGQHQLELRGLYDRYGELDDLPNPLWHVPSQEEMLPRLGDRRFENNFEWYLTPRRETLKPSEEQTKEENLWFLPSSEFPSSWRHFKETKDLSTRTLIHVWQNWIAFVRKRQPLDVNILHQVPENALRRLARLGAIFPEQITDDWRRRLAQPLCKKVELPSFSEDEGKRELIEGLIHKFFPQVSPKKREQALRRLGSHEKLVSHIPMV